MLHTLIAAKHQLFRVRPTVLFAIFRRERPRVVQAEGVKRFLV